MKKGIQKRTTLLGTEFRKVQPKLRVIANGSKEVNAVRAELCGALIVEKTDIPEATPMLVEAQSQPSEATDLPKSAKRGNLKELAEDVYTNVFIQTNRIPEKKFDGETARRDNIVTARVNFQQLKDLTDKENVTFIEAGANILSPKPVISKKKVTEPLLTRWSFGSEQTHKDGEGVLIGIIDVQGFDFSHPDFLDKNGQTRFIRIWDQGGDGRPSPNKRDSKMNDGRYDYGSELTKEHLDSAIKNSEKFNLPAYHLEPQSQMEQSSHGTHVASIAAGNHGVCSKAMIAGVLISIPEEKDKLKERRMNFFDSTCLAHAVDYLINLANKLDDIKAVAINISLGTNGHAHDGSSALNRWIDSAVSLPGRSICVAAGNAGQEIAEFEGDMGYVMGRIHTSGRIPARGLSTDIEWLVVGNGRADISENELEIWYSSQDRFSVRVKPPGMDWIGPIEPRSFIENKQLSDKTFISIYNEVYNPANGSNYISVYLSPFMYKDGRRVGITSGKWIVRIEGLEIKDGKYHGWIERDDPRPVGRSIDNKEAWRFPSYFSEKSNVDDSSVSSLGCGFRIISVANLDEAREIINITSSQGPTRDGRSKPDVAAPGTSIVAANGFASKEKPWVEMTGTSMASPFVTGVVGLMLAVKPTLTAAQIEGIVQCTANPLPGADFKWLNNAGFGRINPNKCLEEAESINIRNEVK